MRMLYAHNIDYGILFDPLVKFALAMTAYIRKMRTDLRALIALTSSAWTFFLNLMLNAPIRPPGSI